MDRLDREFPRWIFDFLLPFPEDLRRRIYSHQIFLMAEMKEAAN